MLPSILKHRLNFWSVIENILLKRLLKLSSTGIGAILNCLSFDVDECWKVYEGTTILGFHEKSRPSTRSPAFHSLNEGSICLCIFAFLNIHYVWKPLIWHDTFCCWLERCRWQGLNVDFSRLFWRSRLPSFSFYASPPLLLLLFGDFFLFLESLAMQLSDFSHLEENAVCNIKWKGLWEQKMI